MPKYASMKQLGVIYLDVFIDLLAIGIIIPVLPFFTLELGKGLGLGGGSLVGISTSSYAVGQLFGTAILGYVSDRIGRRKVLTVAIFLQAAAFVLTGFAKTFIWLVMSRFASGAFGGSISVGAAYIVDATSPEERPKYLGLLGACIGMGFILGPAAGAAISVFGFAVVAFVSAGLGLINFVIALAWLHDVIRDDETTQDGSIPPPNIYRNPSKNMILCLIANFSIQFGFAGMQSTYGVLGIDQFQITPQILGLIFVALGVTMVITQAGIIKLLVKKFGAKKVSLFGTVFASIGLATIPLAPYLSLLVIFTCILAFGIGLFNPTLQSILSMIEPEASGAILGLSESAASLARAIGPIVAGLMYDVAIGLPYWIAAFLALVTFGMLLIVKVPKQAAEEEEKTNASKRTRRESSIIMDGTGRAAGVGEGGIELGVLKDVVVGEKDDKGDVECPVVDHIDENKEQEQEEV